MNNHAPCHKLLVMPAVMVIMSTLLLTWAERRGWW
jgi:hypothetical protein